MELRVLAIGLVLMVACAVASTDGEAVSIPANKHANLDPISLMEMEERADAKKVAAAAAMEAAAAAARQMDRDATRKAGDITPSEAKAEDFSDRNPHEDQMDDLFGSMRKQQMEDEQREQRRREDQRRFNVNAPTVSRLGENDDDSESLSMVDDLGENDGVQAQASASAPAPAPAPAPASNLLESSGDELKPGVDEFQSYSTGHVTEEVQVGSNNGILAGNGHAFASGADIPKGRVAMFGAQAGLYLDDKTYTWGIHSDKDNESGGVCLMTTYNKDVKGLKVCHTNTATGMWASGNVGVSGNLMIEGTSTVVDVERMHLHQPVTNSNGYVLKVGGGGEDAFKVGVSDKASWMQVAGDKPMALQVDKGNVGFGTEEPDEKMTVKGTMAVDNLYVGTTTPIFAENKLLLASGAGWEMTDELWMRVIGNKGVEASAGAYFTEQVGVNFNWKVQEAGSKVRINDGKIGVTRDFDGSLKGTAYFYDDSLGEGRVYSRDYKKNTWFGMTWEAETIIFNPEGKNPIAIGTRTPKEKYLLHIEGNNKIDGHIYVAKKMKVGGGVGVQNMHTPRLNVKDPNAKDGNGQEPSENVEEFTIGEYDVKPNTEPPEYSVKAGGTNLKMGYYQDYCWMQNFPKGSQGPALVLNGAGNRIGFGTVKPYSNIPGSGASLLFHVEGSMMVEGQLIVNGQTSSEMMETETLIDVGVDESATVLHHLNAQKPKESAPLFGDSEKHKDSISLHHVAATLTQTLKHHQDMLKKHENVLSGHESRLTQIDAALSAKSA